MAPEDESPETAKARDKLKEIFKMMNFYISEFVKLPDVTNNIGERIWPPYEADMILIKEFVLELDSKKLHGTRIRRNKDKWKNTNLLNQMELPTVRLLSKDVNKQTEKQILAEIEYQLRNPTK